MVIAVEADVENSPVEELIRPRGDLIGFLEANDLDFYCRKETIGSGRRSFNQYRKKPDKVSVVQFRLHVYQYCEYWKVVRRKRLNSHPHTLTFRGWERLVGAVERVLPLIQGRSLGDAVEIVRIEQSCSPQLLMGLPRRLRVWRNGR